MKLKDYLFVFQSVLIFILPDILYNILNYENYLSVLMIFGKIFLSFFLIGITMFFTKSFYRSYLIVGILYVISSLIETVNVIVLKQYISRDNISALFNTHASEANEFFNSFSFYFIFPLLVVVVFIVNVFIIKSYYNFLIVRKKLLKIVLLCLVFTVVIPATKYRYSTFYYSGKNNVRKMSTEYFLKQPPFSFYYSTYKNISNYRKNTVMNKMREDFNFKVQNSNNLNRPDIVVLVVGEGMRYSNWSINGYKKETSPLLKSIPNLISFKNHFSNGNSTSVSFPLIITRATPENRDLAHKEKSIISLFKEAGYDTNWIVSQEVNFLHNENEPNHYYKLYGKEGHTDLDVITCFNRIFSKNEKKKIFILVNLVGRHGKTPKSFDNIFKPNSSSTNGIIEVSKANATKLTNDYDNKILFQDYVISKLIKKINGKKSSVLIFTSDHGVNLFDSNKELLFGYGSSHPTEKELHIPFFVWGSDKYISDNNIKFKILIKNRNKLTTNNNIFSTLSDLSNISYTDFNSQKSICNDKFQPDKKVSLSLDGNVLLFNPRVR